MIEDHGHWVSDTVFAFNEPVELGPGLTMREVDVSMLFIVDPDISRDMVIEALLDGAGEVRAVQDPADDMLSVRCPDCDKVGYAPASSMPAEVAKRRDVLMIRCPSCRDRSRN